MRLLLAAGLLWAAAFPASAGQCPVKGPRIQWTADYCMWTVESDDIVAADPCMREEGKRRYRDDCEAKKHYKRQMCRMAIRNESIRQTEAQCFRDPSFVGMTVGNHGVGS